MSASFTTLCSTMLTSHSVSGPGAKLKKHPLRLSRSASRFTSMVDSMLLCSVSEIFFSASSSLWTTEDKASVTVWLMTLCSAMNDLMSTSSSVRSLVVLSSFSLCLLSNFSKASTLILIWTITAVIATTDMSTENATLIIPRTEVIAPHLSSPLQYTGADQSEARKKQKFTPRLRAQPASTRIPNTKPGPTGRSAIHA